MRNPASALLALVFLLCGASSLAADLDVAETTIARGEDQPAMPVRVAAPRTGKRLPVVVFSHGAYSSKDDYSPILDHWAAKGYVVIAVTHRDSTRLGTARGTNDPRFMAWRKAGVQPDYRKPEARP